MKQFLIGFLTIGFIIIYGLWLQALCDERCGPGNRWDADELRCVREYSS